MSHQPADAYEFLHFRGYLNGGNNNLLTVNWPALQSDLALISDQSSVAESFKFLSPKIRKRYLVNEENHLILKRHSLITQQLLGMKAVQAEFPGGRQRCSFRLILENDQSIIVTRRPEPIRARFESLLMRRLERLGAAIPGHLAFNGLILLQEDLPGIRLAEALQHASEQQYETWMSQALKSLLATQHLAHADGLQHIVPIVGAEPDWLINFIDRTALLGSYMQLPCPTIPANHIYERLMLLKPVFSKWDARPGNAMLSDDGEVSWFDWEHCCARNPMDDVAWLLCDDAVPEYPETEARLIDHYLTDFTDGQDAESAFAYLSVFGTHHACIRICRLLGEKANDSWSVYEQREGVPPGRLLSTAQRLCHRAARWALKDNSTAMLSEWFLEVAEHLPDL